MTKVYYLPDNAGFVIEKDDANGFQFTVSGNVVTKTQVDVSELQEGLFGGDITGPIQNAIIAEQELPGTRATLGELELLLEICIANEA